MPFGVGGPGDVFDRLFGQKLSQQLGQQFVIENRPGAGGNIGAGIAGRAPADGSCVRASVNFMVGVVVLAEEPKGCQTTAAWNLLGSTILSSQASCISRNRDDSGVVKLADGCNA